MLEVNEMTYRSEAGMATVTLQDDGFGVYFTLSNDVNESIDLDFDELEALYNCAKAMLECKIV